MFEAVAAAKKIAIGSIGSDHRTDHKSDHRPVSDSFEKIKEVEK